MHPSINGTESSLDAETYLKASPPSKEVSERIPCFGDRGLWVVTDAVRPLGAPLLLLSQMRFWGKLSTDGNILPPSDFGAATLLSYYNRCHCYNSDRNGIPTLTFPLIHS